VITFNPVGVDELPEIDESWAWSLNGDSWILSSMDYSLHIGIDRDGDISIRSNSPGLLFISTGELTALYIANGVPFPG
jgi:hypothetical protein